KLLAEPVRLGEKIRERGGRVGENDRPQSGRMGQRVLLGQEAAPGGTEDVMATGDPERIDEVVELADEQLDRPELGAALRVVRRASVSDLVVEDDRAAVREVGKRKQVVVRRARAAMERDQRRGGVRVVRVQVAVDSVPGLGDVTVEAEGGLALVHAENVCARRSPS